jgi:hypothetical protein
MLEQLSYKLCTVRGLDDDPKINVEYIAMDQHQADITMKPLPRVLFQYYANSYVVGNEKTEDIRGTMKELSLGALARAGCTYGRLIHDAMCETIRRPTRNGVAKRQARHQKCRQKRQANHDLQQFVHESDT